MEMFNSPKVELEQCNSSGKQAVEQSLKEEVVDEKNIKMDPVFPINDYISIRKLGKIGNQSDLHRLRQLSGFYYEIINPKYFDLLDAAVVFGNYNAGYWISYKIGNYIKPKEPDTSAPADGNGIAQESSVDGEIDQESSDDEYEEESDDYEEESNEWRHRERKIDIIAMKSSGPRPKYKLITTDNWTQEIAPTIRKLELDHINFLPEYPECHGLNVPTLISQMSPYITTLKIILIPTVKDYYGQGTKFGEFMNQLTNLKLLQLKYREHQYEDSEKFKFEEVKTMEVAQLEIMIRSLNRKTLVVIEVLNGYNSFLSQFKSTPNTKLIFTILQDFDHADDEDPNIAIFKEIVKSFELYPTQNFIEFDITVDLATVDELKEFTALCLPHKEKIKVLRLKLKVQYEEQDVSDIRKYLALLSPIVTKMTLNNRNETKEWNILSTGLDEDGWKNLTSLDIWCECDYMYPLDILKKCPKLQNLLLVVSPECFFHDTSKTDEEVILEYFGNLPSLTQFNYGAALEEKFGIDGKRYLKTVLPKGTKFICGDLD